MKRFFKIACLALAFTGCKKNSGNPPVIPANLAGTWQQQSIKTSYYSNGVLDSSTSVIPQLPLYLYYTSNFSGTYMPPGINGLPFTYALYGNNLTYHFAGNNLDFITQYNIKALTATRLELTDGSTAGNGVVHDNVYIKVNR